MTAIEELLKKPITELSSTEMAGNGTQEKRRI